MKNYHECVRYSDVCRMSSRTRVDHYQLVCVLQRFDFLTIGDD